MKSNPYDPKYVMTRDKCTYEEANDTINGMKVKNAWNKGKKIKKSNPYDPKYVMTRDKCTYEEANDTINEMKAKKATSKANFIKKYGKADGLQRYNEWKGKSLAKGWAKVKENGRSNSPRCKEYYMRHGRTEEEAISLAIEFQHNNSPLHIQYYINRSKTLQQAKDAIRKIHDKKLGIDSYRNYLQQTTDLLDSDIDLLIKHTRGHNTVANLGQEGFDLRQAKIRKTMEQNGIWIPLDDMSDYQLYHREVWKYTNQHNLTELKNYEHRGLAGIIGAYHLDHKFSISSGYINCIPPTLIGSIANLEFITWEENTHKQGKCSITTEELINEN